MRHLRALPRNPELLVFATIQPLMFVVLFVYVFGGSVDTSKTTGSAPKRRAICSDRRSRVDEDLNPL